MNLQKRLPGPVQLLRDTNETNSFSIKNVEKISKNVLLNSGEIFIFAEIFYNLTKTTNYEGFYS